ncbi:hypothetical protein ACOSP7_006105 [Xanthoceras sorbifolium]
MFTFHRPRSLDSCIRWSREMESAEKDPLTRIPDRLDVNPVLQDKELRETMDHPSPSSRTYPVLQPTKLHCVISVAEELHVNSRRKTILKARRSIPVTPNSNAKQSQSPKTPFTKLSSLPVKSVLLYDWWLVPAHGKGLAVGGFASRESLGVRTFGSAAIVKRHDTTTLETADGITVTINGFINRSRTHLNGFPLEVCNHFLLGFPYYWEEYANQCCDQASVGKGVLTRISCVEDNTSTCSRSSTFQPFSSDEIPVTRIRDFFISPQRDVENGCLAQELFDEVLQKCGYSSVQDKSARKREKNSGQSKMDSKVCTPSRSIVTRSMSRLKNLG